MHLLILENNEGNMSDYDLLITVMNYNILD